MVLVAEIFEIMSQINYSTLIIGNSESTALLLTTDCCYGNEAVLKLPSQAVLFATVSNILENQGDFENN